MQSYNYTYRFFLCLLLFYLVKDLDYSQSYLKEILEFSEETMVTLQDRLDRLLVLNKKIQDEKENTAREFVALNEKTDELSVKRAWLIKMVEEIEKISYCVNRLSVCVELFFFTIIDMLRFV